MAIKQIVYKIDFDVIRASQNLENLRSQLKAVTNDSTQTTNRIAEQTKQVTKAYENQTQSIQANNQARRGGGSLGITNATSSVIQLNNELDKTDKTLSEISKKGSISFSDIAKGAVATMGAFSAVNAVTGALRTGFNTAVETEKFETALEVMLGSADVAKAKIKELTEFAAKTPLEMPDIQDSANTLIAFGIEADKLVPTMKTLGDIARGNSVAFGRLSLIFGQARATGRVMTGDLNQLANLGVPILRQLAKNFNVTESQVRTLAEAGKIGFKDLETALMQMSGAGGQFENLMLRMSDKTAGKLSTLKDNFSIAMAEAVRELFPLINLIIDISNVAITKFSALFIFLMNLPKFVMQNKVAIGLLLFAFVSLNAQLAISTVLMLKDLAVRKLVAIETKILTANQWLYNQALKANPIGLTIAGFTALIAVGVTLNKVITDLLDTERARKQISEEANEQAEKEQATYALLFDELKNVNTEGQRRVDIINQINAQYSEYLGYQLQEHDNLLLLQEAQEGVNRAIRNNILIKMQQEQTRQAMEQMIEAERDYIKAIKEDDDLDEESKKRKIADFRELQKVSLQNAEAQKQIGKASNIKEQLQFDNEALKVMQKNLLTKEQINKLEKERNIKQAEYNTQLSRFGADNPVTKASRQALDNASQSLVNAQKHNETTQKNIQSLQGSTILYEKQLQNFYNVTRQNIDRDVRNIDREQELQNKLTKDVSLFGFWAKITGINSTTATGAIMRLKDGLEQYADASIIMEDQQEGVSKATVRNTEAIKANTGAVGQAVKAKEFQLEAIKADTEAIIDNTNALITNRKELEQEIKLRDAMRDPIQKTIADTEKLTKKTREEAEKRVADARKALDKQYQDREADLRKQNEQAKAKIAEAQFEGGKNAPKVIAEYSILADENKLQEQLGKLKANYADELIKINNASQTQQLAVEEHIYIERVNELDKFLRSQRELYLKSKGELEELNFQLTYNLLSAEHRSYNDRLKALDLLHARELEKENKVTDEKLKIVRDTEMKLSQARAKEATIRIQLNRTDLTADERKQFEQRLRLQKLESDSYEEYLKTNRNELETSLNQQYRIEQDYFDRLTDLYVKEAEKQTEQQINDFNNQLEINRLYKTKMFALAQSLRDETTRFENTDQGQALRNEINALENRLRAYKNYSDAYIERERILQAELAKAKKEHDQDRVMEVYEILDGEKRRRTENAIRIMELEKQKQQAQEEGNIIEEALIDDKIKKEQSYAEQSKKALTDLQRELDKAREEGDAEQIERLEKRLKAEQDLQKKYAEQEADTQQEIDKKNAQYEASRAERRRQNFINTVSGIQEVATATIAGIRQVWEAEASIIDKIITTQQDKVKEARDKANESKSQGDAEMLQLEEERLDKLNKQKEDFVAKQRALATIELVVNTAVMIAKAAAEGGGLASAFTIAAALASLTFGLVAARQTAESALSGFRDGGDTGTRTVAKTGRPIVSYEKDAVGVVHEKEYVFTKAENEKFGKYFKKISSGELDLTKTDSIKEAVNLYTPIPIKVPSINGDTIRKEVMQVISNRDTLKNISNMINVVNPAITTLINQQPITIINENRELREALFAMYEELKLLRDAVSNQKGITIEANSRDMAKLLLREQYLQNRIKTKI